MRKRNRIAYYKTYHEENREQILSKKREYYHKNKIKIAEYKREKLYGISLEEYNTLLENQKRSCATCLEETKLQVDHDHKTSKVRGLLCCNCNGALGKVGDNKMTLQRMIEYLS